MIDFWRITKECVCVYIYVYVYVYVCVCMRVCMRIMHLSNLFIKLFDCSLFMF